MSPTGQLTRSEAGIRRGTHSRAGAGGSRRRRQTLPGPRHPTTVHPLPEARRPPSGRQVLPTCRPGEAAAGAEQPDGAAAMRRWRRGRGSARWLAAGGPGPGPPGAAPARPLHLCRTRLLARRRERGGDGGGRSGGGDRGSVSAAAEAPLEQLPPCAPGPPRGATQRSLAPVISSHNHRRLTVPAPGGPPSAAVLSSATLSGSAPPAAPEPQKKKNSESGVLAAGRGSGVLPPARAAAPAVIVACCC